MNIRYLTFSDAQAFSFGLGDLEAGGLTPRGLLFLALEPTGAVHLAIAEDPVSVASLRVGEKLVLPWDLPGRYYHYDSVHRLRPGHVLYNGDRRLHQPGAADEVAGALTLFLQRAGRRSVFFGCRPHQPGSWLASRQGVIALHDSGFVDAVVVHEELVLARRIMDDHLWLLTLADRFDGFTPVFDSPLGNVLMLERRVGDGSLVLTCERGLVEVDVSRLPDVKERARFEGAGNHAVVGRLAGHGFTVTRGTKQPWGFDDLALPSLVRAPRGSITALGKSLGKDPVEGGG